MRLDPAKPEIDTLVHATYDPRKRRAYYLKTRKLKGRKKGGVVDTAVKTGSRFVADATKSRTPAKSNPKARAGLAAQVARLKTKLGQLKQELARREQEASKAQKEASKKPTAADKRKQARQSKQYRNKNQQVLKNKAKAARAKSGGSSSSSQSGGSKQKGSTEALRSRIQKVERDLAAAVARQRALR